MSDNFLDHIPSSEREKIRKRLHSPEAYEALREKVKGPEDLEREMERSEKLAEARFAMESEPAVKASLKQSIEKDIAERGAEAILENISSSEVARAIEQGRFTVAVEAHPQTHEDALVVVAEGNVQEKIPVKQKFSEQYVAHVTRKM